jgi:hypothetical protein
LVWFTFQRLASQVRTFVLASCPAYLTGLFFKKSAARSTVFSNWAALLNNAL